MSDTRITPNFYVAGTAKSGTTSLAAYFREHPDVCFCKVEEPNFFAKKQDWALGFDYYEGLYDHYNGEAAIGEKSWRYSCFETYPQAWERMKAWSGDFKVIYIAREPFSRACSMWRELRDGAQDIISREPGHAINNDTLIVESSHYHRQVSRMIDDLGRDQVLLLFFEDFISDPDQFYGDICDFLGVEQFQVPEVIHANRSVGQGQDGLIASVFRRLGLIELVRRVLPKPFLSNAAKILKKPIGDVEVSDADREQFLSMIDSDKRAFLALAGKPSDFWDRL